MSARVLVADIQAATARLFGVPVSEMTSDKLAREFARPRQVAMYVARRMTSQSWSNIGRRFGNRNHATVTHAVKRIEELRVADQGIDDAVTRIMAELGA